MSTTEYNPVTYVDVPLIDPETGRFPDKYAPPSVAADAAAAQTSAAAAAMSATQAGSAAQTATTMAGQTVALQDGAVSTLFADENSESRGALNAASARAVGVVTPALYGAAADGVSNDYSALASMYSAAATFGLRAVFEAGKTYKVGSSLTASVDTDLNGSTLNVTGRLIVSSGKLRNGKVKASDKILASGLTAVRILDITYEAPANGSNGIMVEDSTDVVISGCVVTGGSRGIVVDRCSEFTIRENVVRDVRQPGAYGILVRGADELVFTGGSITGNKVTDCYFGITLWGGEADASKSGFIADDYTLHRITISGNEIVCTDPADALIGCIYVTRSRWITAHGNSIQGGRDVGIDFEYCADSVAVGNTVNDVDSGGLTAIFGCRRISFIGNKVTFTRTKSGAASSSGITWKGTSNCGLLLRDDPQDVRVIDNTFHSLNGTLMQLVGSNKFDRVTFSGNDMLDAYYATFTMTAGDATAVDISRNRARFTININRPVIQVQVCLGVRIVGNDVQLLAGEAQESKLRPTICVVDPSTEYSSGIVIRDNRVLDPAGAANNQIGVITENANVDALLVDNIADRIVGFYLSGAIHPNFKYGRNTPVNGSGLTRLTAHDNGYVWVTIASVNRRDPRTTSTVGIVLTDRDTYVYTGSGTTWTLPPVSGYSGAEILIRNRGTGAITLNSSAGGNDIFAAAAVSSLSIAAGSTARLLNDGTYWLTL